MARCPGSPRALAIGLFGAQALGAQLFHQIQSHQAITASAEVNDPVGLSHHDSHGVFLSLVSSVMPTKRNEYRLEPDPDKIRS